MRRVWKRNTWLQVERLPLASFTLNSTLRQQIIDHAVKGRPNEVCGLVGGRNRIGHTVVPLTNADLTPSVRYRINPVEFVAAYHRIERNGDELIGIYHSHPIGAALPSSVDIAEATWPDAAYLIVGFPNDVKPELAAWSIRRGIASPIALLDEESEHGI